LRRDVLYWIGTDVLEAVDTTHNRHRGDHYAARVARFVNIAGVERLTIELQAAGIDATTVPYPGRMPHPIEVIAPMPDSMMVLTYIPDARRDFYGMPAVLWAARSLPEVRFVVMGGTAKALEDVPPNMTFTGFVEDPQPLYDEASVLVRHVMHDGAGLSVAEALLHAREVVYSFATPHTRHVPYGDVQGLVRELRLLETQHHAGGIPLNLTGRAWALKEYDAERRFEVLLSALVG
jgi:glycosyltransferase involved in cell wall biosynthesis